jgi:hypothetical protein
MVERSVVQSSKRYTKCVGQIKYTNRVREYNIRLENDGLAAMGLSSLPISTLSIFYYPFCFLIQLLNVLSKNALVRLLAD